MFAGSLPAQSNRADINWAWQLSDIDSAEPVDLTGMIITLNVIDKTGAAVLSGSTSTGEITTPGDGVIAAYFPKIRAAALKSGAYSVSVILERDGFTEEPFNAQLAVIGDE